MDRTDGRSLFGEELGKVLLEVGLVPGEVEGFVLAGSFPPLASRCALQGWLRAFFFPSRRRHTRFDCDWSSDVCSSDLAGGEAGEPDADTIGRAAARMVRHDGGLRIGAIDGAGRAIDLLDAAEREALRAAGVSADAPLGCVQAATGRLGAAAAAVQAIALGALLARRTLPRIAALAAPAEGPLEPSTANYPAPRGVLAISTGAPGLAAAVFIEDPRP